MLRQIRWRLTLSLILVGLLILAGLSVFLARPTCVADLQCIRRSILVAGVLVALSFATVSLLITKRMQRTFAELSDVMQRISAGDMNARTFPQTKDEIGQMALTFNQMMDQIRTQLATFAVEHQQLTTVLEKMADGVLITDEHGFVTLINPAATNLLATSEKQALGRNLAEVLRHHQLIDLWRRCRQTDREQVAAAEIGQRLFLQAFVTPYLVQGSRAYLVILQNLTQLRHLQTVRRDFISNISHELRTPLASLRIVVETLQDGALKDKKVAYRFLERAEHEVDTLTQLVEELLELSRIESGQVPLRLEPTAVADLVQFPLERLSQQAERANLTLTCAIPADLPLVLADITRIQQVVSNLVHNAIKFTPNGGTITINASANAQKIDATEEVVITVTDNGIGITKDDLPRIFERFYKSDRARTRSHSGTGLGLAITRHVVQAHNGRIWVKSKEGKGSTFYFTLPVSQKSLQPEKPRSHSAS